MPMSFRRNVIATYSSQIYVTLAAIVMVPLYVRYMGAEAYGLVGFFAMLQMWFQLLDMGLSSTMARETARFQGGARNGVELRRLLRTLEGIFIGLGVIGAAAIMAGSDAIAAGWLKVQQLPLEEVRNAVILMAAIVALRWVCGLYRGAITGFEQLVWLSGWNAVVATVRFVLVIPFFIYVGTSPTEFFDFQLAVALVETAVLVWKTYRLLPEDDGKERPAWDWAPLRSVLKFSLGIAFTNSVWVVVTQTDKLLLSKLLPLSEYGYFTLAVLVASGVLILSGPISGVLLPRLTRLSAEGDEAGLIRLYRDATQLVGVIAVPASLMLACFARQVLWAWTGNAEIAARAAPVLTLYALGNGILALGAFPYYLQFAKGDLRLHIIGNALFVVLLVPALVWGTRRYGAVGAGYAWLAANLAFFLFYVPRVHARFVKGLHLKWLTRDVSAIVLVTALGVAMAHGLMRWPDERLPLVLGIAAVSLALLGTAAAGSSWVRRAIGSRYRARFAG
jgi:O-antigen/teichoic acid export membrane protein